MREEQKIAAALRMHAKHDGPRPEFPYDDLAFTLDINDFTFS